VLTSGSLYRPTGPVFSNLPGGGYGELTQFAPNGGPIVFANRYTEGQSVTQDFSFNAKLNPVEKLHINLDAQYVKSNADSIDDNVGTTSYGGFGIDVTGSTPKVTFQPQGRDPAAYFANPSSQYFHDAMNNRTDNDGTEWAFRGDVQYDFSDDSFLRKVRVGGRYAKRDQTVRTNDYSNWGALSETWTSGGPVGLNTAPNETALFQYQDFYRNDSTQPPATNYISDAVLRDHEALTALLRRVAAAGGGTYVPLEDRADLVDNYFKASEYYRNKETTWSAYARVDFGVEDFGNGMSLSGNVGVRFVHTKDESFGALTFPTPGQILGSYDTAAGFCGAVLPGNTIPAFCLLPAAQQTAVLGFANSASFPDVASQSFNHWLPSANVKLQVTDQLLFRLAGSKAISRPAFGDLRNFTGVTPGTTSAGNAANSFGFQSTARNPYLRPVEAKQFDLTAEWYFAKVGSLTGALFYKQLSNIILDNYGYNRTLTNNGQTFDVLVNGPANAPGKGNVKGAELSYQQTYDFLPGFLSGLGAQATFTYVKPGNIPNGVPLNADLNNAPPVDTASLYANLPLTGLSSYNYNLAAFYDKSNIYARFAYSWRSKFLLTNRDCCFPFLPVYALSSGQMDGSVFLTVNKNFKIGVEGQNLLNSVTKTAYLLNSDGLKAPRSSFISDRQITLTTRLTF
jgi:TonB-dependent receptor